MTVKEIEGTILNRIEEILRSMYRVDRVDYKKDLAATVESLAAAYKSLKVVDNETSI